MRQAGRLAIMGMIGLAWVLMPAPAVRAAESPDAAGAGAHEMPRKAEPAQAEEMPKAFGFAIDYTYTTDYVWRGINLSEYDGEGSEDPNHQMGVGFTLATEPLVGTDFGTFGVSFWFEWYGGQAELGSDGSLQEVDYTVNWARSVPGLPLAVELGWIAYEFPQLTDDGRCTQEIYASLALEEEELFGMEIVNPYFAYYLDVDDVRASWMEFGISHEFTPADVGAGNVPCLEPLTVTPSFVMGIDHRYYDEAGFGGATGVDTHIGNLQYGLDVGYDIGSALGMPPEYGSVTLNGFLRFSQAIHNESPAVYDTFWGGFTVGYAW